MAALGETQITISMRELIQRIVTKHHRQNMDVLFTSPAHVTLIEGGTGAYACFIV